MKPKPPPPPPAKAGPGVKPAKEPEAPTSEHRFAVLSGRIDAPQRVVLYGPGGIGKSSLAALAPNPVFLDIEGGTGRLDVPRVEGLESFVDVRACLHSSALDGFQTIVLDTCTKGEELAIAHTLATVPHEKGHRVTNVEAYGFGKGFHHVYDTFLLFLADMDRHLRASRNIILIAHDCVADVPNPVGDDWIRYEPHLQAPKSGKASIRNRVVQWADHVLFIGYDVVASDGKGKGVGTRTIYPAEMPSHLAKSRSVADPMPFEKGDGSIWSQVFGGSK